MSSPASVRRSVELPERLRWFEVMRLRSRVALPRYSSRRRGSAELAGPGNDGRMLDGAHQAYSPAVLGSATTASDSNRGEVNRASAVCCMGVCSDMATG